MEKTINKLETLLVGMNDVYSQEEVKSTLQSVLISVKADEEEATKYKIHPEHIYQLARDKYQEVLNTISNEVKDAIKHFDFEEAAEIDLTGKTLEVNFNSNDIADEVMDELLGYVPDADDFYESLKTDSEDDNKDQTEEDLKIMELKSEYKNLSAALESGSKGLNKVIRIRMTEIEIELRENHGVTI